MAERDWNRFKKNVNEKRMKKKASKEKGKAIPDSDTIVIQQLSAEVSGKAQKYARVGAREFVPFHEYGEFSVQNIKSACMKHFDVSQAMCCDVLAGEQGPSCSSVKQIPDYKVIHVRFVERSDAPEVTDATSTSTSIQLPKKRRLNPISNPGPPKEAAPSKFMPRSLSVVEMLKLGKAINNTSTSVEVQSFDIKAMVWSSKPTNVDFIIDTEPFGIGGFRKALKATSSDREFNKSTWVVKRYLPKAISDIIALGQTVEQQSKKVVQMHYLARNFAAQLKEEVIRQDLVDVFGETLQYKKILFGKIETQMSALQSKSLSRALSKSTSTTMGRSAVEKTIPSPKRLSVSPIFPMNNPTKN